MDALIAKVNVEFITDALGTMPGDEEIVKEHILAAVRKKHPDLPAEMEKETLDSLPQVDGEVEKQTTYFYRDEDGNVCMRDYQLKGFFKSACGGLRRIKGTHSNKMKAYKKQIDLLIHVYPKFIKLNLPEGKEVGILERPLRAQTPQGERVCLARSELVPEGTKATFEVHLLQPEHEAVFEEWMEFAKYYFYGQWRNAGHGRAKVTWEYINKKVDSKQ